jgi:hypothetical protein
MRPTQIGMGDGPWYGNDDIAVRTSNVGYDEISSAPSVPRKCVSMGSSTHSSTAGGETGACSRDVISGVVAGCATTGLDKLTQHCPRGPTLGKSR